MTGNDFRRLAHILTWAADETEAMAARERRYLEALSTGLGHTVGLVHRADPEKGRELRTLVEQAGEAELVRILLLPATGRRLLTRLHDIDDIATYLRTAFTDARDPAADVGFVGSILGRVPVFADDVPAMERVRARIENLFAQAEKHCPPSASFVRAAMRELLLRTDPAMHGFFSNSPQGLIGRAVLTNAHLDMVDDVMLVEAVVHEAVHGFLDMCEAAGHRWLLDQRLYDGLSRVASPWTGRRLDIPAYLHACFVWWGLLHLWSDLAGAGVFEAARVGGRMARAAEGFRGPKLVDELRPYRDAIAPGLLDCLTYLCRTVGDALAEIGPGAAGDRG
jgi:hypothetical protein